MTAAIFTVNLDTFDVFVAIAVALFLVAGVVALLKKPHAATISYFGLAVFALAQLWLTP